MAPQTYRLWLIGIGAVVLIAVTAMLIFAAVHGSSLTPADIRRSVM